ncbi:MAG: putative sugar O-methyltransferase [Deltaproteobacteria bacterium]|nr:putative sugar O-methyltransferase [Deltaproteobacteria bacterium]
MIFGRDEMLQHLYGHYWVDDATPEGLTSSHWREQHGRARVQLSGTEAVLEGEGFGDMRSSSALGRMMSSMTITMYMLHLAERRGLRSMLAPARRAVERMNLDFTYDAFRQLCTIDLLKHHLGETDQGGSLIGLEIGGGYGVLAALERTFLPNARLVLVDLGRTLLFQAHHLSLAFPESRIGLVSQGDSARDVAVALASVDFLLVPAEQLDSLVEVEFDFAVNVASMQEMNAATVAEYFSFMRRYLKPEGFFYCCNRLHKKMPDGEISEFYRYPWKEGADRFIVDGPCPWNRYFLAFHRTTRGPKVLGVRVPLVNWFDGETSHRLVVFERADGRE